MPFGWLQDPTHGGPKGIGSKRYISPSGQTALDFDPAQPGAGGEKEKNHWHELIKNPKGKWVRQGDHIHPGDEIEVPDCDTEEAGEEKMARMRQAYNSAWSPQFNGPIYNPYAGTAYDPGFSLQASKARIYTDIFVAEFAVLGTASVYFTRVVVYSPK